MAYREDQIFTPYERFSNRVPYLPQAILMVGLSAASLFMAVNTGRLFIEFGAGAITHVNFVTAWDWAGVFRDPFASIVRDLALNLVGLTLIAIAMRYMPLFHECGRPEPQSPLLSFMEKIWIMIAGFAALIHLVLFALWCAVGGLFMIGFNLIPLLFNYILMPPAFIAVAAVHFFVLYSGFSAFRNAC